VSSKPGKLKSLREGSKALAEGHGRGRWRGHCGRILCLWEVSCGLRNVQLGTSAELSKDNNSVQCIDWQVCSCER
jgi:hypothetical protein